ncbi:MAG TPA: hypothetical protein VL086_16015 [Candidatus Nitrosotalea sp.]|nr:hypothetical protein [Candidatus Nitrosotalea sp.]
MRQRIAAGIGAGLVAGVIFAVVMRILPVAAPDGRQLTMTAYAARLIHAVSPRAGWLVYLAYAVLLGALYGAAFFAGRTGGLRAAILGGAWGLGWFVLTGFGVVPALLGDHPFSAAALQELTRIGVPLLVGHIVYGLVLGSGFNLIMGAVTRPGSSGHTQHGIRRAA